MAAPPSRPLNVLLVMTDQQRADHVGFGGHPLVRTPNLDALAARGRRFDRCHVANPICMPNRASILTGRMPSVHGTRVNGIPLDWRANTFARVLRSRGYDTALVGKAHFQNMGQPGLGDQRPDGVGDAMVRDLPPDWDLWEEASRHLVEWIDLPPDYYGFDHVDLVTGHTDAASGHYVHWLRNRGVEPGDVRGVRTALERFDGWNQVYQSCLPTELYHTSYVAERACAQLERVAHQQLPFLLQVSFPDPHHPFGPPGEYFHRHDPAVIPLPATWNDDLSGAPPHIRAIAADVGQQHFVVQPFRPTEEQYRHAAAAELGMIELLDDAIGQILGALTAHGLAESTLVIFTSDHGEMMGDHGLILKGTMHYAGCTRVPLVVSGPNVEPGSSDALVSSLDIPQTILDCTESPPYSGMQGRSLRPLLTESATAVRDSILIEEDQPFDAYRTGHGMRMRSLITEESRLTVYDGTDFIELYDLAADPDEMTNLAAGDSGADVQPALEALVRSLIEHGDRGPRPLRFTA